MREYWLQFSATLKTKWQQLLPRERLLITVGGGVFCIFLIYQFVFVALDDYRQQLIRNTESEYELREWMRSSVFELQQAQARGDTVALLEQSLLSVIEQSLRQDEIGAALSQIGLAADDSVRISFAEVPFDSLIEWITQISSNMGVC